VTLKGRSALITGSNGGIGYAFAIAFAEQGCNVVLNGPASPEEVERLRAGIAAKGVRCIYSPADVGVPEQIGRMMSESQEALGGIDILINNAVVRHFHPIEAFPPEEWDRALAVNVSAAFHTIRLALPGMKTRNWGRIINMGSIHSLRARENRVDYITAKHAIIGLTKTVAIEVAQTGITCNALQPGWVLTPHAERQIEEEMKETGGTREQAVASLLALRQPSRRFVTKEEVAALAVFLCSDAAANITGSALSIDGGWSAAS
jgi:3-hydroxybutyrate dehydrogenase